MVSYIDAFWFLFVLTLCAIPMLLLLLRSPKRAAGDLHIHMD